jgi:hypothetical protein
MSRDMKRPLKRLKGWRKTDGFDVGFMKVSQLYVYDPIFLKIKIYAKEHHRWIIGIVVAVLAVPTGVYLQKQAASISQTSKNYYLPHLKNVANNPKDADCWGSLSSMRHDAFRCAVGNVIYDPCFKKTNFESKLVGCPETPNGPEHVFTFTTNEKQATIPEIFDSSKNSSL